MRIVATLLLQGALGGALVVVLALALTLAVVVAAAVFGGAIGDRSGEEAAQTIAPPGTILAATRLGLAVLGAFFGSTGFNFVGIAVGAVAYYRGARLLGGAACVLSFATIFIGYYFGTGAYQFDL